MFRFAPYFASNSAELKSGSASRKVARSPDMGKDTLVWNVTRYLSRTASAASAPTVRSASRRIGLIRRITSEKSFDLNKCIGHLNMPTSAWSNIAAVRKHLEFFAGGLWLRIFIVDCTPQKIPPKPDKFSVDNAGAV